MKAKNYFSLLFTCLCLCQSISYSQCTTATYGQFPTDTYYVLECDGDPEVIAITCFAGEYSSVYLDYGNTYEFSSNINTDYLTIYDTNQNVVLVSGTSPVSFQATFTGEVRFYTHVSSNCDESEDFRYRNVSCSSNLGVSEQNEFDLAIYPNPASTFITISANEKMDEIQVISVEGKLLSSTKPTALTTTLSLELLQAGTYFIRASVHGITTNKEVIVE